jgi:hypothetical protein
VTKDGEGIANHVGSLALRDLADGLGLTRGLSAAMQVRRERRPRHDPGAILRDLTVMLADGGDCVSDLGALRDQSPVFGPVASTATAWRLVNDLGKKDLQRIREARKASRAGAWGRGRAPKEIVLDIDATLVTSHSEKEKATPNFKRGYGFHPVLCHLEESGEALAGILRAGNATANDTQDNLKVLDRALEQLPKSAFKKEILVRGDSALASHDFIAGVRERSLKFSVGLDLYPYVREAVLNLKEGDWQLAISQDGDEREAAAVAELKDLDLSAWPSGTRAMARRERPHPGAQLKFSDIEGNRIQVFITDQQDEDIVSLEARHRARARDENHIRCAKATGLENLPFHDFKANRAWLELILMAQDLIAWFQRIGLRGDAREWEPKALRYRLFHVGARIVRSGRRLILRLQRSWPWTVMLYDAFRRVRRVAATA